uniref:Uncharacterized protein n=1 Tax=viral metagenome TaxID=1070528 RepID=A0A6M3KGU9_9ZZZZ
METKYYGINVVVAENGYYLIEERNGGDQWFDHLPTDEEIENFRNNVS